VSGDTLPPGEGPDFEPYDPARDREQAEARAGEDWDTDPYAVTQNEIDRAAGGAFVLLDDEGDSLGTAAVRAGDTERPLAEPATLRNAEVPYRPIDLSRLEEQLAMKGMRADVRAATIAAVREVVVLADLEREGYPIARAGKANGLALDHRGLRWCRFVVVPDSNLYDVAADWFQRALERLQRVHGYRLVARERELWADLDTAERGAA